LFVAIHLYSIYDLGVVAILLVMSIVCICRVIAISSHTLK
jgi:hypothetical protein